MNYDYIANCALKIMRDYWIIQPPRMDIMHYIDCEIFFARAEKREITANQIAGRVAEIARLDYIATCARCNGHRVPHHAWNSDIDNLTGEDGVA